MQKDFPYKLLRSPQMIDFCDNTILTMMQWGKYLKSADLHNHCNYVVMDLPNYDGKLSGFCLRIPIKSFTDSDRGRFIQTK